jgi:hypothetical protein
MKKPLYPSNGMEGFLLSEEEAMEVIMESSAYDQYLALTEEIRSDVLDFIRGKKGLKITYDPFFKHIFNPVLHDDRLSRLLSCLIGEEVKVRQVLATESNRTLEESSLVIMDIVVELKSGALANAEIQKYGYKFPGQRSACYSSDLVIRQYDIQKSRHKKNKKKFNYRKLKKVYTIVLLEESTEEFHSLPHQYIHHSNQEFDTGLKLNLLQEYIFVALDIFHKIAQNVDTELDAWLHFLSSDDPVIIRKIIEKYPAFRELYREIALFQRKPEELIKMYNETLAQLDKNTVDFMIEEWKQKVRKMENQARIDRKLVNRQFKQIYKKSILIDEQAKELEQKTKELELLRSQLKEIQTANTLE